MQMISDVDRTVSSTFGTCISFQAGVPREVPEILRVAALTAGCLPHVVAGGAAPAPNVPAEARDTLVQNAIRELIARNDESNFNKTTKLPKVAPVREITGLEDVNADEIAVAFQLVNPDESE